MDSSAASKGSAGTKRPTKLRRCWTCYLGAVGAVDRRVNAKLGKLGHLVDGAPVTVLLVTTVVALALSCGFFRVRNLAETSSTRLWCVHALLHHLFLLV